MKARAIPLSRALSKLRALSRAQATEAIRAGRVRVDGRVVRDPAALVAAEGNRLDVDGTRAVRPRWRTILFYKPRGVVTTHSDPEGRPTIFDRLGDAARGLVAVGRLDMATSGLLLLTSDTRLADRITNPANRVPRVYLVTVRGRVEPADVERLTRGIECNDQPLRAHAVVIRKASDRESHLTVELREGRNREVRRLCEGIGCEVVKLKRVALGGLTLGTLAPGEWRVVSKGEVEAAFGSSGPNETGRARETRPVRRRQSRSA